MEVGEHMPQEIEKTQKLAKSPKNWKKVLLMSLMSLVLLGAGASAGYYWRDKDAKSQDKKSQAENTSLKEKLAKSEKELAAAKKTTTTTTTTDSACVAPTASALDNIKASITSGNTAALEGYMAPSVKVIIAASEGIGDRTPAQAVGDVAYLNPGGTNTWDFALPAATITNYQAGSYKQYFTSGALVGKAADGHVVSFQFDCKGKISGIFMAASADLL